MEVKWIEQRPNKMKHGSLFSGIGGPEVAASMLGWENVFHCEINPFGRKILEYWFPNSESYDDITKTDFTKWHGRIDVLTGGFPCQPFSYAGKRGGREDERYLWPQMLRAIDEIRPTWVVGENVAGITTMVEGWVLTELGEDASLFGEGDGVHRYELIQTFTIERICSDLEALGYSVQPVLIPAAAVGAPHRRDRIFILAHDVDTDGGDDEGRSEANERESVCEGVQERDEVRLAGVADQLRPSIRRSSQNTQRDGRGIGADAVDGNQREFRDARAGDDERLCGEKGVNPSDTLCGNGQRKQQVEREIARREGIDSDGSEWDAPEADWLYDPRLLPENRWRDFPTVSPVHRGNDGIPIRLDDLSIPFGKWRTESLKAYGNAIVPQVMYRIFQAIEQAQRNSACSIEK